MRGNPVGHVEVSQRLPFSDAVQRGAHVQAFDETRGARLHKGLVALVEGDVAHSRNLERQRSLCHFGCAHAQILLNARADRDLACFTAVASVIALGIDRHQHHVHKRRLGGAVELIARHHRVLVVQHLAPGGRVQVSGLDALVDMAARGCFAFGHGLGDHTRAGGSLCIRRCAGFGSIGTLRHALLHTHLVHAEGQSSQHADQGKGSDKSPHFLIAFHHASPVMVWLLLRLAHREPGK